MGTGIRLGDGSTLEIDQHNKHVHLKFTKGGTVVDVHLMPEYALAAMYGIEEALHALRKVKPETYKERVRSTFKGLFK